MPLFYYSFLLLLLDCQDRYSLNCRLCDRHAHC